MIRRVLAAGAVIVLLAGCSGGDSSPSGSQGSSSSAAPSAQGNAADWKLGPNGFGPVKLGAAIPEGYKLEPETDCKGQMLLDGGGKPVIELWTAENAEVTTIIATENTVTDKGVKVGDSSDAVTKAYSAAKKETLSGKEALVLRGKSSALVFEVTDSKVAHISLQPTKGLHAVSSSSC